MKISAKVRKKLILQELMRSSVPISIEQFANQYDLKNRSILYDIENLNFELQGFGVQIQNKSKQGYYIPQSLKFKIPMSMFDDEIHLSDIKDMELDAFFTILLHSECVPSEMFATKFHMSSSSVHRLLSNISLLKDSDIRVESTKFQGYSIVGSLISQIKVAATILSEKFSNYYSIEDFYSFLPTAIKHQMNCDYMIKLDELIRIQNQYHDVWLTNKQHQWILFCWMITLLFPDERTTQFSGFKQSFEHQRYVDYLLSGLKVDLTAQKRELVTRLLDENTTIFKKDQHESDAKKYIQMMIEAIDDKESYDIVKLAFDLYPHITETVFRKTNQIEEIENPLAKHILSKYPKDYHVATHMAEALEKVSGITSNETHISYFAMYLYKNRKDNHYRKLRVVLICATGRGFSNLMQARLMNRFPNIDIIKTMSAYHFSALNQLEGVDLVISTNPLSVKDLPIVVVTPILGNNDLDKIRRYLDEGEYLVQYTDKGIFNQLDVSEMSSVTLPMYSVALAKISVRLLDTLTDFIDEYDITHDHLLGLTIHLLMAVERWVKQEDEMFEDAKDQYDLFAKKHPRLTIALDEYFEEVEHSLQCYINYSERIAFFHYIV